MAEEKKAGVESENGGKTTPEEELAKRQALLEARAISEATATADSSYVPSPALLASTDPLPLLKQVDGPDLAKYSDSPNVYVAKHVPIGVRKSLDVPIYVTVGGSVVEYSVTTEKYDISFGIVAERDEKETIVKANEREDTHLSPCTGKFLVGTVPCTLVFTFDNQYSWITEKSATYKITVTPPSKENVMAGRRRRAKATLKSVNEDASSAGERLENANTQKSSLESTIEKLEKELEESKKNLEAVTKEVDFLSVRCDLRKTQISMLNERLEKGWEDETSNSGEVAEGENA